MEGACELYNCSYIDEQGEYEGAQIVTKQMISLH